MKMYRNRIYIGFFVACKIEGCRKKRVTLGNLIVGAFYGQLVK
jgi:hypothetical protein